jgi:hypothetical protein
MAFGMPETAFVKAGAPPRNSLEYGQLDILAFGMPKNRPI